MSIRPAALLLSSGAFLLAALSPAFAEITPIPGVDAVVKSRPAVITVNGHTVAGGSASFTLKAGMYEAAIDPKSLATALAKLNIPRHAGPDSIVITIKGKDVEETRTIPYRADSKLEIDFTVPKSTAPGAVQMTIFDRWGNL